MSTTKSIAEIAASSPRNKDQGTKNLIGPRSKTQRSTDTLARYLADKLQAPNHQPAFLKIAWRLDEAFIHSTLELAMTRAASPRGYFITSCKNEMRKRGVA